MAGPVLVVEDAADGTGAIRHAAQAEGFRVSTTRSVVEAMDDLWLIDPLLAVVDWHVGGPGRASDVLRVLATRHPAAVVIVVSATLNDVATRRAIAVAHPSALTHDRQGEPDSLRLRIRAAVGRPFGDLAIRHGVVVHIPCGRPYRHEIATRLVAARGRPVLAERLTAAYLGARRFQAFLELHGSPVRVVPFHSGLRYLVDTTTTAACLVGGERLRGSSSRSSAPLHGSPRSTTS